ncbi:MAG: beta-glucosidase [Thermoflexales bacterium]|nr:beta-glucosidase [Thermoflexales bacterium]
MNNLTFPPGFMWGAATASYQIEGGWNEDGKGESVWDRFAHTPGMVQNGDTGDVACDHYHRWARDVQLMRELGLKAYRFSIGWPRILPNGRGPLNQPGLDFYSRLVDKLLEAGITPFATLNHWDMPQALLDEGGWPERATTEAFVEYADVVTRHLGDRVKRWATHNEPLVIAFEGYCWGSQPPGQRGNEPAGLAACHHLLLSHGMAVPVIRRNSPGCEVGIVLCLTHSDVLSPGRANLEACRQYDGLFNRWYLDPLYGRHYPADMVAYYTARGVLPPGGPGFVQAGDMDTIATPTDFLGVNYYTRAVARDGNVSAFSPNAASTSTEMGWEIYPHGLYCLLNRLHFEYRPARLYVTENGAAYSDGPDESGRVRDQRRLEYLRDHFTASHRAIQNGVPLAGYFVWSLLDNFEWAKGYSQRFGIVWVDYETQARYLKDSALWYKELIAQNGLPQP